MVLDVFNNRCYYLIIESENAIKNMFSGKIIYCAVITVLVCAGITGFAEESNKDGVMTIRVVRRFYDVRKRQPRILRELMAKHPNFRIKNWSGIEIERAGKHASMAMSMAANNGPDIITGDVRQFVSQGLVYPLTEWIGQDGVLANGKPKLGKDGKVELNGRIDADEAKWSGWMKLKPVVRQVCTIDGKPYALPRAKATYVGILFSRSLLKKAGLDSMNPPRNHEEFIRWCRKVYNHDSRSPGVALPPGAWIAAPWVATTGSSVIVQERTSPKTGKTYTFNEQEQNLTAPDTGEDLSGAPVRWKCNVAGPGGTAVIELYHRLRWEPWIVDPKTGEPVSLTKKEVKAGEKIVDGRKIKFSPDQVITGCIFPTLEGYALDKMGRTIAMYHLFGNDLTTFQNIVDPADLGMMPFPGMTPDCKPVLQGSIEYAMIGKDVPRRGGAGSEAEKRYRDFVWQVLWRVSSSSAYDETVRQKVASGQAQFLNPRDLKRLGFEDYVKECPPEYIKLWNMLDNGKILEVHEPFMGRWELFSGFYQREIIDIVLRPNGKNFDYKAALKRLERDANSGIMFEIPQEVINKYRPIARVIAGVVLIVICFFLFMIVKSFLKKARSTSGIYKKYLPWFMLVPAVGSIALWSYYPLARGLLMAFQNYQIGGKSPFVGLDNFIKIFLDPNFYHYIFTTFKFVLWNLALAFFTPIILAMLLSEVPRFKIFFRTLFFLPQMISALVVTLMWKEMFNGTADGTINRVLTFLFGWCGFTPVDWLGSPVTVMACVIIPGLWGMAGMSSLIYLAALKSVPEELYEAATMDGAGIFGKIRHITMPTILPLVMINFVGAFIATFQGMASIFLLTFGGPGKETMVMAMAIWQEAYVNLRFSLATSYAWLLGSMLIGFTYLQMRILNRVDFRQAKG